MTKILFVADFHIPYENKRAVNRFLMDLRLIKPEMLILGGDIVDFYSVSHFRKEPNKSSKINWELNKYYAFMDRLRSIYKGKLVYIIGNHERRINKYLMENTELWGLESLTLSSLLRKEKYNFNLCYKFKYFGTIFTHGTYVGDTCAKQELAKYGRSGVSGHKHQYNVSSRTNTYGQFTWISAPCMCDINKQEYIHEPNWQLGYVLLHSDGNKLYKHEVTLI
jgi:predicted phosphodiesterase